MIEVVPPFPEIPDALKIAAQSGRLILFIGAGVSRLAKCPSWEEFGTALLRQLVEHRAINFSQAQQITAQGLTPRMKLSFIRNIATQRNIALDYAAIVHHRGDLSNSDGRRLYRAIGALSRSFVTTNYDYWLDFELAPERIRVGENAAVDTINDADRANIIFNKSDISFDRLLIPGTVIHLHGSLRNPNSMIVTTKEYLEFYQNVPSKPGVEGNSIITFLRTLFNERVVLFIGYGLADQEMLEYIILKSQISLDRPKHFILQSFYSHELEVAKLYDRYYTEDCGMVMLPYSKDDRDHLQLLDVLETLAAIMPGGSLMEAERQIEMEAMLNASS